MLVACCWVFPFLHVSCDDDEYTYIYVFIVIVIKYNSVIEIKYSNSDEFRLLFIYSIEFIRIDDLNLCVENNSDFLQENNTLSLPILI